MAHNGLISPDFIQQIPDGDDRERRVCRHCAFIDYDNPRIVVGTVAVWENHFLLCRRAIEPRKGFWTLPAGYMEHGESAEAGALREAWEEARATIEIDQLLAIYSVPAISQVQLMYRGTLVSNDISAGPESKEVGLFLWDDIPWDQIAFPTVHWALHHFRGSQDKPIIAPYSNPANGE